jgi:hypothetical protein
VGRLVSRGGEKKRIPKWLKLWATVDSSRIGVVVKKKVWGGGDVEVVEELQNCGRGLLLS